MQNNRILNVFLRKNFGGNKKVPIFALAKRNLVLVARFS